MADGQLAISGIEIGDGQSDVEDRHAGNIEALDRDGFDGDLRAAETDRLGGRINDRRREVADFFILCQGAALLLFDVVLGVAFHDSDHMAGSVFSTSRLFDVVGCAAGVTHCQPKSSTAAASSSPFNVAWV